MVHRLILSYRGAAYAGWQRQTNAPTVQQAVEEALAEFLREPMRIHGASRTDAGVHARGQVAHLHLPRPLPIRGLVHGTNHLLAPDIRVLAADRMPETFHARKSALGKEYLYRVYSGRVVSPLDAPYVMQIPRPLNASAIRRALGFLPGRHDFTAFALSGGSHGQPVRRLFAATVDEVGPELHFRFWGDGFLRGMVRSLVGTLVEVGLGQRSVEEFVHLLSGRPRNEAGPTAAAQGLVLVRVLYGREWQPEESYRAG